MALSFEDLRSRDNDTIDREYINRRWRLIAENIRANSERIDGFAQTEARLLELGLQRISEVLGPALQSISAAAELGFLVQPSDTEVEMALGVDVNFTVSAVGARGIFSPTPFLAVMDVEDDANWAIVKLLSYNKEAGVLGVRPLFINGAGAGADWVISSSSGFIPAMETALTDTVTAKETAVAAAASALADKNIVAADKATVTTYRNQAQAAAAAAAADAASVAEDSATIAQLITVLDDGPVLAVNGRVGAVTLDKPDVGLGNVENTALSTWAGSANITTLGTVTAGTWGGSAIAVDKGGTGATDGTTARANLGLVIGTNVQAWDADLDAISSLAGTSGFLKKMGADAWALDTTTYLTSAAIGTSVQAYDADLDTWATKTAPTGTVVGTTDTQTLSAKTITGLRETRTSPEISSGTLTLNCSDGNVFAVSLNANISTLSVTNVPATGSAFGLTLALTADGTARTVNWGSAVKWPGGTAPTLTSTNGKVDTFVLYTHDGGTTWYGFTAGLNA